MVFRDESKGDGLRAIKVKTQIGSFRGLPFRIGQLLGPGTTPLVGRPSGSGYASSVPYTGTSNYSQSQAAVTPPVSARYMVKAKGNLWVLVQDQFGNEVDWRKLQAGDQFPINQAGSLTVTLSSSDKADILDSDNKKIEINSKNSGISIVRLP